MKLVMGLGNPGERYESARHNLGFMALERFLKDFSPVEKSKWETDSTLKSQIASLEWQRRSPLKGEKIIVEKIILAKPLTYMNNSGLAAGILKDFYKLDISDIWVIHDEVDLPLGAMKIRFGGGSAGHKGVESILLRFNSDKFWRFRLGIGISRNRAELAGQKRNNVDEYVLGPFDHGQSGKARELIKRCSKAIMVALESGLESAMNKFNTK